MIHVPYLDEDGEVQAEPVADCPCCGAEFDGSWDACYCTPDEVWACELMAERDALRAEMPRWWTLWSGRRWFARWRCRRVGHPWRYRYYGTKRYCRRCRQFDVLDAWGNLSHVEQTAAQLHDPNAPTSEFGTIRAASSGSTERRNQEERPGE